MNLAKQSSMQKIGLLSSVVILSLAFQPVAVWAGNIERVLGELTHLDIEVDKKAVSLFRRSIQLDGVRFLNPLEFEDVVMMDVPLVEAQYRLGPLLHGEVHLKQLSIYVKELMVVKRQDGIINIDALGSDIERDHKAEQANAPYVSSIVIDRLALKVDRVTFREHTPQQGVREFSTLINHTDVFDDIRNPHEVFDLILARADTYLNPAYELEQPLSESDNLRLLARYSPTIER